MAAPYLGGLSITGGQWVGATSISVSFSTTWGTSYLYQLYAGRTLIGATSSRRQRKIVGQLVPTEWPQYLQVLAVAPADRDTDFGGSLPPRPYNRAKVHFTATAWPADSKTIEIRAGNSPGGAVDPENVVARAVFNGNRAYELTTEPLEGSGAWSLEVVGRDGRLSGGNEGDALAVSVDVIATPPDVSLDPSTLRRFSAVCSGGVVSISFNSP